MSQVLRCDTLTALGFRHGFSLRTGGTSEGPFASLNLGRVVGDEPQRVELNRQRFAAAVGYTPDALYEVSQVHGAGVVSVDGSEPPERIRLLEGDAVVASEPGLVVGVRTADCLGVLLADPASGAVAAVHSGWRSTVANVSGATVGALLERHGVVPGRLHAVLLPHIRECCFEVGDDVAERLVSVSSASGVVRVEDGRAHVRLASIVRAQLSAAGLQAQSIHAIPGCTACEPERFFSHRRDGAPSGRHLAVIAAS